MISAYVQKEFRASLGAEIKSKKTKANLHAGSSFDDFLKEDGIFEEVQARVRFVEQLETPCKPSNHATEYKDGGVKCFHYPDE